MGKAQQSGSGGHPPKKRKGFDSETARRVRPAQPALRHGLYADVDKGKLAKAERRLTREHPHLKKVDAGRVRTLAHLDALLAQAWMFFTTPGRQIASSSRGGKTKWDPGLARLMQLEELRLKLCRELMVTPRSRREAGVDDDGKMDLATALARQAPARRQ